MGSSRQDRSRQWIRSVEVDAGRLQGQRLEFDPALNVIIGGRGAGKTTAIELLRYALKDGMDPPRRKDVEAMIRANLRQGQVRVGIETGEGVQYSVLRSWDDPASVRDAQGRPAQFKLTHGVIFGADVYGWMELESIARDRAAQRKLIDRFAAEPLAPVNRELQRLEGELTANASAISELARECGQLQEGLGDLPQLLSELQDLANGGDEPPEEMQREVEHKGLRDYEVRTFEGIEEFLRGARGELSRLSRAAGPASGLVPPEVLAGPNRGSFQEVVEYLVRLKLEIEGLQGQALAALDRCDADLSRLRASVAALHACQEDRYRSLLGQHEQERDRAGRRVDRQRRVNELRAREHRLSQCRAALERLRTTRRDLLAQTSALRNQRYDLRAAVVERLNRELESVGVKVTLTQRGDSSAYQALLSDILKGESLQRFGQHVERLTRCLRPGELVRLAEGVAQDQPQKPRGDGRDHEASADTIVDQLTLRSGVPRERCRSYLDALARSLRLPAVEAVDVEDEVEIRLDDEGTSKTTEELSAGQRCTALLPIVLLESDRPLVIDQPEDCLDNRFIAKTLVASIMQVKRRRQLIFVTHNPNIPVLGWAERVFVLESSGDRTTVRSGTVDGLRDDVEQILEGGPEAFQERARRYQRRT